MLNPIHYDEPPDMKVAVLPSQSGTSGGSGQKSLLRTFQARDFCL